MSLTVAVQETALRALARIRAEDKEAFTSIRRVLAALPEDFALECVMRMLRMEPVQREILDKIEQTLRTEFMSNLARTSKRDSHEMMAEIFNSFDRQTESRFIAALEERNRESAERIRALIRRGELARDRDEEEGQGEPVIARGPMTLDPGRHLCTWLNKPVELTVTEFLILKSLAQRPGHVKNRDQLMDAAYGEHIYVDDRTIDSHIKRLRKKFKAVDTEFAQIETLYGVGYRYRDR